MTEAKAKRVSFVIACLVTVLIVWVMGMGHVTIASPQKPLDRFLIRSYSDGPSGLTMHVVEDQRGEGCWLFAESSRGLAIASTDLGVCYDTERE